MITAGNVLAGDGGTWFVIVVVVLMAGLATAAICLAIVAAKLAAIWWRRRRRRGRRHGECRVCGEQLFGRAENLTRYCPTCRLAGRHGALLAFSAVAAWKIIGLIFNI